jgi:hypothetical protein
LVGNGFCNDETNNEDCNYDGGDCCVNTNINSCSECECHIIETCAAGYHPLVGNGFCDDDTNIAECDYDDGDCCSNSNMVGDGICNDYTNNAECGYDGGDCCGYNINSDHCTECACFHQETCLVGLNHAFVGDGVCNDETNNVECEYDGGDCCLNPNMVGDAICHDETNHLGCNYDGGDCCVNVNTDSCTECNCLGSGVITSPGFPGKYDINLDLTWLIQVQLGQTIEIHFLFFDVDC